MAGSLQPRVKTWVSTEDVTYSDLNAEFDNVLLAMQPLLIDDYSTNVTQMQVQTDPGDLGSESLATTLAGDIARLRFEIREIKGSDVTYWYEEPNTSLSDLRQLIGGDTATNRIASGAESASSSQLRVLIPDGSNDGFKIDATPTPFVYYINNIAYTISADVTVDGISKAPASNNTCLVDDTNAADGQETRFLGEYGTVINIDTAGSEITGLVGKTAGFKINNGADTEYFIAYVDSATQLSHARRGGFVDSTGAVIPRIVFSNNDTITLMKLTYIFATTAGAIALTYNEPVYSATQPSSPATGDYWYDLSTTAWKKFNGTAYEAANAILVGQTLQDATNCVAAVTFDQFTNHMDLNTIDLEWLSNTEVRVKNYGAEVVVFGTTIRYGDFRPRWDMTLNLDSGITEAASTTYYLYVKESGAVVISNLSPHDRRGDRKGYYHPTEVWRCVGKVDNNASSHLNAKALVAFSRTREAGFFSNDLEEVGTVKACFTTTPGPGWLVAEGASVSRFLYRTLYADGLLAIGDSCGTASGYVFSLPQTKGLFLRGRDNAAGNDPDAAGRIIVATGGATGDNVGSYQADVFRDHTHQSNVFYDGTAGTGGAGVNQALSAGAPAAHNSLVTLASAAGYTTSSETRPKNISAQYIVKVLA
jgi:hypothetical protein